MLKKLLTLSLVAVMLVATFSFSAVAADEVVTVEVPEATNSAVITDGILGGSVTLALNASAAKNAVILTAVFNGTELKTVSVSDTKPLAEGANTVEINLPAVNLGESEECTVNFYTWEHNTLAPLAQVTPITVTTASEEIAVWTGVAATEENAPEQDSDGYYKIETGEQLAWFSNLVDTDKTAKAKLMNDIYLNYFKDENGAFDEDWYETETNVSEATKWNTYKIPGFKGEFDGAGKTIYGLYITGATGDGTGFFSSVAGATVKDVTFKGAYAVSTGKTLSSSDTYTSGANPKPIAIVAGKTTTAKATFSKIDVYGKVTSNENGDLLTAGGIIGNVVSDVDITECNSYVDVVDYRTAVADNASGTTAPTAVLKVGAGGIIGFIGQNSAPSVTDGETTRAYFIVNIVDSNNYGDVVLPYQSKKLGGIVGHIRYAYVYLTNCGNAGNISGKAVNSTAELYGNTSKTYKILTPGGEAVTDALPNEGSATVYSAE